MPQEMKDYLPIPTKTLAEQEQEKPEPVDTGWRLVFGSLWDASDEDLDLQDRALQRAAARRGALRQNAVRRQRLWFKMLRREL